MVCITTFLVPHNSTNMYPYRIYLDSQGPTKCNLTTFYPGSHWIIMTCLEAHHVGSVSLVRWILNEWCWASRRSTFTAIQIMQEWKDCTNNLEIHYWWVKENPYVSTTMFWLWRDVSKTVRPKLHFLKIWSFCINTSNCIVEENVCADCAKSAA